MSSDQLTVYIVKSDKLPSLVAIQDFNSLISTIKELVDECGSVEFSVRIEHMSEKEWNGLREFEG